MGIDPLRPSGPGAPGANPSQTNAAQGSAADPARAPAVRQTAGESDGGDTIQLSTASLALQAQAEAHASVPPSGTMSTQQMQAVLNRVVTGYYDQPDVHQAVAQRLAGGSAG